MSRGYKSVTRTQPPLLPFVAPLWLEENEEIPSSQDMGLANPVPLRGPVVVDDVGTEVGLLDDVAAADDEGEDSMFGKCGRSVW